MIRESDLLRFVEGDCTPDEAAAIQAWITADPRRAELLEELRAVWRLTGGATRTWDAARARERLRRARFPLTRVVTAAPGQVSATGRLLRVAAVLAVVFGGGAALWHLRPHRAPFREYVTAPGQRSQVSFPDGTRILLGVATRLRVPREYGQRDRVVELQGEAYFVVQHDSQRPFVVRTARGTTEDLGTAFDVRAYPDEQLQVVVAAGSVALRGAGPAGGVTLTLRPRDRAVIDARGAVTLTSGVALDRHLAWIRGVLRFDDAPLDRVIAQLDRWYDLDIRLDEPALARERVTIAFTTPSADEALAALAGVLNVRFTRAGRVVRLATEGT